MVIFIEVKNKIAKSPSDVIVCGNSDYIVHFQFDDEWREHKKKTARFIFNGQYIDVLFEGDKCACPVITNSTICAIGVFAGDLATTTPALVTCKKSILCESGSPAVPFENAYEQIFKMIEEEATARKDNDTLVLEECTKAIQAVQKQTVEVVVNEQNERARNDKEIRADISDIKGSNEPTPSEGLDYTNYWSCYAMTGLGSFTGTELVIPNEYNGLPVEYIGAASPMQGVENITSITLLENALHVESFAFGNANSVETIKIGAGMQSLGINAFNASSLKRLIVLADNPPTVADGIGSFTNLQPDVVLEVPENAIDAYKAHDVFWGKFVTEYGGIEPIVEEKAPSLWGLQEQIDEINKNGAGGSGKNYDTEIASLTAKDAELQSQIDEMSASNTFAVQALNQKDADLQAQITKEKADREAQDNAVLTAAANAIQANNGNIIQIIVDEQTARANKDTELQGQIDKLSQSNTTLINSVNGLSDDINTKVNAETTARQEQFNDLTNTINEIHSLYEEQIADLSARVLALESTPIAEEGAY